MNGVIFDIMEMAVHDGLGTRTPLILSITDTKENNRGKRLGAAAV